MDKRNLPRKTTNYIFDGIRKCLDIPNQIGYPVSCYKKKSASCYKSVISAHAQTFESILIC